MFWGPPHPQPWAVPPYPPSEEMLNSEKRLQRKAKEERTAWQSDLHNKGQKGLEPEKADTQVGRRERL